MSVPIAKGVTAATDLDRVRSSSSERPSETADAAAPVVAPARPRWRRWLAWLNPIRKRVCPYPGHETFVNAPWLVALGWLIFGIITIAKYVVVTPHRSSRAHLGAASSRSSSSVWAIREAGRVYMENAMLHAQTAMAKLPSDENDDAAVTEHDRGRGPIGTVHCLHGHVDCAGQQVGHEEDDDAVAIDRFVRRRQRRRGRLDRVVVAGELNQQVGQQDGRIEGSDPDDVERVGLRRQR